MTAPLRIASRTAPTGTVGLTVIRSPLRSAPPDDLREAREHGLPRRGLPDEVNEWRAANVVNLWRGFRRVWLARKLHIPTLYGVLRLTKIGFDGEQTFLGLASLRVVTNTGAGFLTDAIQNLVEPELLKFHGIGTGTNAEAAADTALQTELTTQYAPDNTRATGTLAEFAANVFQTVATNTVDASVSITEHGIFTQAATGGGVLLDRSVFTASALASGEGLQTDYRLTIAAGS